jgi:alkanesulfonate monooxygenase SsuD/methylene tetrahydromethanopterin reductase-like flavin-dependent oxidoreductase (luciferase family)
MKFDYYLLNTYFPELDGPAPRLYASWLEQALAAERLGYDTLWATEHHFRDFGGMLPNPQVLIAALAAVTQRIRFGTAVSILPLHHPIRIAEDMAMLDNISGGRIDVGVGRGMPHLEYDVYGADWPTAQDYVEEEVAILRGAWTERPFIWESEHYRYPKPMNVMPPPVQQPHPPVWMTANREESHFRWIGQQGLNLLTLPWVLPEYEISRRLIGAYREALAEGGHDPSRYEVLAMFPTHVAETDEEARLAAKHWSNWTTQAFGERGSEILKTLDYDRVVAESRCIFGSPEECRQHVRRLSEELGITHVATVQHFGGMPQERVLESMRLFANEVAAPLRKELAPATV